jgi:saccharopine dehydrogenase-like NADP-dependent oxidoreductase
MKFIFSSFIIGVGASTYATLLIHEKFYERRVMFEEKINEEELINFYYQQVRLIRAIYKF